MITTCGPVHVNSNGGGYDTSRRPVYYIFMPPPLGGGGIMFSGCPYVRTDKQTPRYRDISRMTKGIFIKFGMKVNCGVEMN